MFALLVEFSSSFLVLFVKREVYPHSRLMDSKMVDQTLQQPLLMTYYTENIYSKILIDFDWVRIFLLVISFSTVKCLAVSCDPSSQVLGYVMDVVNRRKLFYFTVFKSTSKITKLPIFELCFLECWPISIIQPLVC